MAEMKTLTINGKPYTVADPDAAHIDDTRVGADAWSSKNIVDKLCPVFTESGSVITCQPVESYPLKAISHIVPKQAGSGDPSLTNIRPITGYDSIKLSRTGKNLFDDVAFYIANGFVQQEDGLWKGICQNKAIFTNTAGLPGKFTLSYYGFRSEGGASPLLFKVNYTDGTIGYVGYSTTKPSVITATTSEGKTVAEIWWSYESAGAEYWIRDVQLEYGAKASLYEPYKGNTFTIDLGQTVYGGTLNWQTGELSVEWAEQPLRSQATIVTADGLVYSDFVIEEKSFNTNVAEITMLCNCLIVKPSFAVGHIYVTYNNGGYFLLPDQTLNTKALVNEYLESIEAQVCYKLETPIEIQLTPQKILALSGKNYISSNAGDTEVTGKADPAAVIADLYDKINQLQAAAVNNA